MDRCIKSIKPFKLNLSATQHQLVRMFVLLWPAVNAAVCVCVSVEMLMQISYRGQQHAGGGRDTSEEDEQTWGMNSRWSPFLMLVNQQLVGLTGRHELVSTGFTQFKMVFTGFSHCQVVWSSSISFSWFLLFTAGFNWFLLVSAHLFWFHLVSLLQQTVLLDSVRHLNYWSLSENYKKSSTMRNIVPEISRIPLITSLIKVFLIFDAEKSLCFCCRSSVWFCSLPLPHHCWTHSVMDSVLFQRLSASAAAFSGFSLIIHDSVLITPNN